ncbi:unnamed protein product [Prorocentrum cordatum]|uniref:Uncharacterized protein n=1 Tax=Prorocentrum cordatum TaxID=2364126 RepID=A0ABN9QMY2_9DINO|nr:unnamed protein product [Polarella glacialis]
MTLTRGTAVLTIVMLRMMEFCMIFQFVAQKFEPLRMTILKNPCMMTFMLSYRLEWLTLHAPNTPKLICMTVLAPPRLERLPMFISTISLKLFMMMLCTKLLLPPLGMLLLPPLLVASLSRSNTFCTNLLSPIFGTLLPVPLLVANIRTNVFFNMHMMLVGTPPVLKRAPNRPLVVLLTPCTILCTLFCMLVPFLNLNSSPDWWPA